MGEDIDPLTTDNGAMSHRGILIIMAVLVIVGSAAGFAVRGTLFGVGVLFGGVLAFANYFWLDRVTKAMFSGDVITSTGILAAKYIMRYAALGLVLLAVHLTGALPIAAVIAGLAAFAFAVVIQGLRSIFTSST